MARYLEEGVSGDLLTETNFRPNDLPEPFEKSDQIILATPAPQVYNDSSCCQSNAAIVGILSGLIVVLFVVFALMVTPALIRYFRRRMPEDKKKIENRYETLEGWLISKVRTIEAF